MGYNGFPDFFIDPKTGDLFVRTLNGNRLRVEVNQQGDVEMWDDAGNFYYIDNKVGNGYGVDVMSPDGTVTNYKIPNSPTDRVDKDGVGKDVGMQSQRLGNVRSRQRANNSWRRRKGPGTRHRVCCRRKRHAVRARRAQGPEACCGYQSQEGAHRGRCLERPFRV